MLSGLVAGDSFVSRNRGRVPASVLLPFRPPSLRLRILDRLRNGFLASDGGGWTERLRRLLLLPGRRDSRGRRFARVSCFGHERSEPARYRAVGYSDSRAAGSLAEDNHRARQLGGRSCRSDGEYWPTLRGGGRVHRHSAFAGLCRGRRRAGEGHSLSQRGKQPSRGGSGSQRRQVCRGNTNGNLVLIVH
jgi:hypothetical protein